MSAERETINKLNQQSGLFDYSTKGFLNDAFVDSSKQFNNKYQVTTRTAGAAQAGLGVAGLAGSAVAAPAACATGIGCVAVGASGVLSLDAIATGAKQAWNGVPESTYTNLAIQATTGLSPEAASYVEMLMGMGAATKLLNVVSLPKQLQQAVPKVANTMDGGVVAKGTANAATYAGLKLDLKTTQAANEAVDSLRATGQLPSNYITKGQAYQQGWQESKAVNNYVPGGQIGGDVFRNGEGLLPSAVGRTWYEADIGLSNSMSRGNAAQPASRLLYSSDGLLYVTPDHYKTMVPIGRWKN